MFYDIKPYLDGWSIWFRFGLCEVFYHYYETLDDARAEKLKLIRGY